MHDVMTSLLLPRRSQARNKNRLFVLYYKIEKEGHVADIFFFISFWAIVLFQKSLKNYATCLDAKSFASRAYFDFTISLCTMAIC